MADDPGSPPLSVHEVLTEAHRAAVAAEFEDPIWGTAVVLAMALARISERMPEFRRVANGADDR